VDSAGEVLSLATGMDGSLTYSRGGQAYAKPQVSPTFNGPRSMMPRSENRHGKVDQTSRVMMDHYEIVALVLDLNYKVSLDTSTLLCYSRPMKVCFHLKQAMFFLWTVVYYRSDRVM
jgi:hypothetical protein